MQALACVRESPRHHGRKPMPARVSSISCALLALAFAPPFVAARTDTPKPDDARPSPAELLTNLLARAALVSTQGYRTQFTFTKVRVTEELDSKGKVTEKQESAFEVVPVNGRLFSRLVSENGKPATAKQRKAEEERERKLRAAAPPDPAAGKSPANSKRDYSVSPELLERFTFATTGREIVNGRDSWVLTFEPRSADLPVRKTADRFLNKVAGKVWIDAAEHEIARIEVRLTDRVDLVAGIIASLKKFDMRFEQRRLESGAWFNTLTEASIEARQLVMNKRVHFTEKSGDFKKVAAPAK